MLGALVLGAVPAAAQTGTVSGQVLGPANQPLANALVELLGTGRTASTNAEGNFMLRNVPAGTHQVRARAVGYRAMTDSATVDAGATVRLDFRLAASVIRLDELVVTGQTQATELRAIGNVVTTIRVADALEVAPARDLQSLLNARSPGTVITPGTGQVGAGSQIRIRGSSSLSLSNTPLLYVDGVRVDNVQNSGPVVQAFGSSVISRINDFNPDDIESIEVIKGPAAATLYGTEAANGVIQIITRRGREGVATWNLTVRQGVNRFDDGRVPTNYWRNPATNVVESINLAETERARGVPLWRTGHIQNYNLSVGGGTPEVRYHVAGNLDREEGVERANFVQRAGGRANLTFRASPTIEIGTNVGYTQASFGLACEAGCGGTTWASYFSTPFHSGTNDPNRIPLEDGTDRRRGARSFSPEYYWFTTQYTQDLARFTGSAQFSHTPVPQFSHRLILGMDDTREDNQTLTEISELYREWSPTGRGGKSVGRRDVATRTVDYSGTLSLPIGEKVLSRTSVGSQYYSRNLKAVSANGVEFALPGLRVINATAETSGGETFVQEISLGVYAQQQFGWEDRRYLTLALRADDHSAFGSGFSLVYYPKASAAWVVSEEPFWNVGPINQLRLRTAFGRAGQQPGAFDALRTFTAVTGPGDVATVTPGSVGNADLGPERGQEIEVGFDASFLDDRAGLEFTYYHQRTFDAILLHPVAPSTGFAGSRFVNVGQIRNFGFEAMLITHPVTTRRLAWDVTLSVSRNDSKVVDLGGRDSISIGFGVMHKEGFPVAGWHHFKVVDAQIDPVTHARDRASMLCDNGAGGTTPCFDASGNIIAPRLFLGRSEPLYEGAFSSTLTLNNRIRVYGLVDFKTGFKKWDHVLRVRCSLNNNCPESRQATAGGLVDPSVMERAQNDPELRALIASYQEADRFGDTWINDASFARLREVSVSYFLPQELVRRIGASQGTIMVAGRNLATLTNWTGMDPEARFLGGARGLFGGLEQNHLPQLTSFVTSINLTF